jgi:HSP20 family protein
MQREEGDRMYIAERHRGSFRRQVTLGEGLDANGVEATYHDGVLTLRIPVAPQAKPRKIEINAGQPAIDVTPSDAETV